MQHSTEASSACAHAVKRHEAGQGATGVSVRAMGPSSGWRASSHSGNFDCVEVAELDDDVVGIRDSKARDGGQLRLARASFADLLARVRERRWIPSREKDS
ncbi:DUF397 domain-containing protein [Spirillospora sp. CA-294931]|uniref:DUF397 domain-containing protein n=1 Tax=Spirillospora sp. CA-294931 TaxID=3240042 RepID=UPI003D8F21FB